MEEVIWRSKPLSDRNESGRLHPVRPSKFCHRPEGASSQLAGNAHRAKNYTREESMEPQPLDKLRSIAGVQPASMTRRERLERWVELLDREPLRVLKSLEEIEF